MPNEFALSIQRSRSNEACRPSLLMSHFSRLEWNQTMPFILNTFLASLVAVSGAACRCDAQTMPTLKGHKNTITCLAFSRDGKMLASGAKDGAAILWDIKAQKE